MLLLDVAAEEKVRAGVLKEVQGSISGNGELVRHDRWGVRELAYPIDHKKQAEYHLLQFRPASAGLLESLDRSLRITDGVVRFRIVKLKPGTPEPPPPPPAGQTSEPAPAEPLAAPPAAESGQGVAAAAPEAAPAAAEAGVTEVPAAEPGETSAPAAEPVAAAEPSAADADAEAPVTAPESDPAGASEQPADSAESTSSE